MGAAPSVNQAQQSVRPQPKHCVPAPKPPALEAAPSYGDTADWENYSYGSDVGQDADAADDGADADGGADDASYGSVGGGADDASYGSVGSYGSAGSY